MAQKVWFITGTSKGFGREWATAALDRGDLVAATARNIRALDDLVARYGDAIFPLALDVNDREADFEAVRLAHEHFGRLDVVINNAGFGLFGFLEEVTEEQVRAQFETNVFGALWITQAALPYLRAQGSGHIIQVSSIGGITAFPMIGVYNASKWALEAFSQSLAAEVASFGIAVTLVEPGGYSTDWSTESATVAESNPAYAEVLQQQLARRAAASANVGNPAATREAILAVVDAKEPPLRIFFGKSPLATATAEYESRLAHWQQWNEVSVRAHG